MLCQRNDYDRFIIFNSIQMPVHVLDNVIVYWVRGDRGFLCAGRVSWEFNCSAVTLIGLL